MTTSVPLHQPKRPRAFRFLPIALLACAGLAAPAQSFRIDNPTDAEVFLDRATEPDGTPALTFRILDRDGVERLVQTMGTGRVCIPPGTSCVASLPDQTGAGVDAIRRVALFALVGDPYPLAFSKEYWERTTPAVAPDQPGLAAPAEPKADAESPAPGELSGAPDGPGTHAPHGAR